MPGVGRLAKPDRLGQRIAAMAGVAGHARGTDMRFPLGVQMLGHLDHASRDHLGVFAVVGEIALDMTVEATLDRRHPVGHRIHRPAELGQAQSVEDLHVLVDVACGRATRPHARRRVNRRYRIQAGLLGERARVVDLLHPGTPVAGLDRLDRGALAACKHQARHKQAGFQHDLNHHSHHGGRLNDSM